MAQLVRHHHGKRYSRKEVGLPDDIQISVSGESVHLRILTECTDGVNVYHSLEIDPDEWDRAVRFVESVRDCKEKKGQAK